jgi:hypothetical protein
MENITDNGSTMEIELSITADESELPMIINALSEVEDSVDVSVGEPGEAPSASDLSEDQRYVLAAVQESAGSALRVIHRTTNELDGSPFDEYSEEDGWNDEREEVQRLLWLLKRNDLVRNDGQQWYPTDEAPTDLLS